MEQIIRSPLTHRRAAIDIAFVRKLETRRLLPRQVRLDAAALLEKRRLRERFIRDAERHLDEMIEDGKMPPRPDGAARCRPNAKRRLSPGRHRGLYFEDFEGFRGGTPWLTNGFWAYLAHDGKLFGLRVLFMDWSFVPLLVFPYRLRLSRGFMDGTLPRRGSVMVNPAWEWDEI